MKTMRRREFLTVAVLSGGASAGRNDCASLPGGVGHAVDADDSLIFQLLFDNASPSGAQCL